MKAFTSSSRLTSTSRPAFRFQPEATALEEKISLSSVSTIDTRAHGELIRRRVAVVSAAAPVHKESAVTELRTRPGRRIAVELMSVQRLETTRPDAGHVEAPTAGRRIPPFNGRGMY